MKQIVELLKSKQDLKYRKIIVGIIPNIEQERIIGVRTPELKNLAKELSGSDLANKLLKELPHHYFEENQLHSFLISRIKDYKECLTAVNEFLPYIDNWATCDQLSPKVFAKHKDTLIDEINRWLKIDQVYTKRFAIEMLMTHFLDDDFKEEYLELVASVKSEEYYLNMMIAWYFATALAKQYNSSIKYIKDKRLSAWVHNKTIQKAVESYRITDEQKVYLKTLKVSNKQKCLLDDISIYCNNLVLFYNLSRGHTYEKVCQILPFIYSCDRSFSM